ncbi:response regulator [Aliikangiella sp. G2MR2-5]|uniref:response regulator n=1 Tax=Aliikangiella sp. G2MR2-5 TaxID=2788943 RepID=UPI0018AAB44D|nr:response regulator [Aliikangiella sp. G2MR2-5]
MNHNSNNNFPSVRQLLSSHLLGVITVAFAVSLFLIYLLPLADKDQLQDFSHYYADAIFLLIILLSIGKEFRQSNTLVDPIYWLLLGAAFFSWFSVSLLKVTLWPEIAGPTQQTLNAIAYFLYYALMIAAIEVKTYTEARQLLSIPSLVIWASSLAFVLGAFIFLVLTHSRGINLKQGEIEYSFVFYMLMDCYVFIRWIFLAWYSRKSLWIGYALLALSSIGWLAADLVESLHYAERLMLVSGSWIDWLWYLPYFAAIAGLNIKISASTEKTIDSSSARSHFLNSPVLFVMICFLLEKLISTNPEWFSPLNATQLSVFNLWITVMLVLSAVQLYIYIQSEKYLKSRLNQNAHALTALKQRMEQQALSLKEQAASNQAILETTHNAIFTLNQSGRILSCNPAACQLLALSQDELVGNNFIEVTQADGELNRFFTYQSYRQKLTQSEGGIEIEANIIAKDEIKTPVHVTMSHDKRGASGNLVVSLINISEQKQAEEEALQLKDQFTQNISHEFRTPLTIINGVLDNLLSHEQSDKDKSQLETAKRNVLRMIRMVEQLLELSRIANDPIPLSTINVSSLLGFVCHSFEEIAKNQQLEFSYKLPEEAWVEGNSQAAEKILFNLLSNAFKYTNRGSVKIELSRLGDHFKISVTDTGVGIESSQLSQIFNRFHRVNSQATQNIQGVGIGLALVNELCMAMRWQIEVNSTPGKGTCFTLTIKQSDNRQLADKVQVQPMMLSKSTQQSMQSEVFETKTKIHRKPLQKSENSVLIVEDNPDMLSHINDILSPYHHCLLADNGEEGVRLAMDYLPDIIVSDVMMPGIDGFELLKTLKKTDMTSHIPIILLTARSDTDSKIKGLEAEADDYLSKPFDAEELTLRVKNQLRSRQKLQQKLSMQWQQSGEASAPPVEDKFVIKLEDVFEKNFTNTNFSMVELASQLAMSERQSQRKIKSVLGISPLEALKQYRLRKAKIQLETGEQIGVVAQSCGFTSQSYFGRCFKETYGMTPKQFQQSFK